MSAPGRPPVTTPFWIGDTVYKKHGSKHAGTIYGVCFRGDPAYPAVLYEVTWPKDAGNDQHYGVELTTEKPVRDFA